MELSIDTICRGELTLAQPKRGYRFNVDSVLLADFARQHGEVPGRVVDLGAGCGVVGLLLARWWPDARVVLVEIQRELAELAAGNAERNGLAGRVEVLNGDLRRAESWRLHRPQLVVTNPPFFRTEVGRASPNSQIAVAKHEIDCTLEQLLEACAAGLGPEGAVAMIHAHERLDEIVDGLLRNGIEPRQVRGVMPLPGRPSTRVLVRAARGAGRAEQLPPLLVESRPGVYSPEMRHILRED
jgi:tRNA1Val (adenine37-N6)-methyltransferase